MPFTFLLLLSLSTLVPSPSVTGVKIVTRQVTGGFTDTRTEYLAADRLRNEWQTRSGERVGPSMASIVMRGDRDRVFVLDLQNKEYVTYETDSRGLALGAKTHPATPSGGTLQIFIESVDTGERKNIFGYQARHIITREKRVPSTGACSRGSESETDGWYIDPSVMPEWRTAKKPGFGVVVASVISAGSSDNCLNKIDKIDLHRTGVDPGFPVKLTTTLTSDVSERDGSSHMLSSTWGSEVVELHAGPLDPALFDVPPDFHHVDNLRNWSAIPRHQPTGWEWFKEKLAEMFN